MTLALSAGILIFGAVYLMLRRDMLRIAVGFMLLSHGVNLIIMSAGGTAWRNEPFGTHAETAAAADPLPQAFVLTAIVISFSISVFMLVTAVVGRKDDATRDEAGPDDDVALPLDRTDEEVTP